jgi:hypothetical protein
MAKRKISTFERLNSGRMNRKERRKLALQVASADPGLSIVNPNAAGIDAGNASHFVAVPPDRDADPVREFGCWTAALQQMAQWLVSCRIEPSPCSPQAFTGSPFTTFSNSTAYGWCW